MKMITLEIDYEKVEARVLMQYEVAKNIWIRNFHKIPNHIPDEQAAKYIIVKTQKGGEENGRIKNTEEN